MTEPARRRVRGEARNARASRARDEHEPTDSEQDTSEQENEQR